MSHFNLVLPLLTLALSGCGPIIWHKPGLDQAEFKKDDYACVRDMKQSRVPDDIDLYRLCMRSKGYTE